MKVEFLLRYERILYYFISFTVLIDSINGLMLSKGISGFGQSVRIIALLYFFYIIFKFEKKIIKHIMVIICFFGISTAISYYFYHSKIDGITYDVKFIFRIIYYLSFVLVIRILHKNSLLKKETLEKAVYNNLHIFPFIMITSFVLNLGRTTYGSAGFIGTFASNNATSITMIVLLIFAIKRFEERKGSYTINVIYIFLMSLIIFLQGSKSSIGFLLITFIYFIYRYRKNYNREISYREYLSRIRNYNFKNWINSIKKFNIEEFNFNTIKCKKPYIIIFSVFLLISIIVFNKEIINIFSRQIHFLKNKDLITFVMSDRNIYLREAFKNFFNNFSIYKLFFGAGYYFSNLENARYLSVGYAKMYSKSIEMDLFDLFFSYGIFGVLFTYVFTIKTFIKKNKKNIYSYIFYIIMVFSIFAGHVFGDALASSFLAFTLGLIIINDGDKHKNDKNV